MNKNYIYIKLVEDLDNIETEKYNIKEEFPTNTLRQIHYDEHVKKDDPNEFSPDLYSTPEKYEQAADDLAKRIDNNQLSRLYQPTEEEMAAANGNKLNVKQAKGHYINVDGKNHSAVVYKPDSKRRTGNKIITYYRYNDDYLNKKAKTHN